MDDDLHVVGEPVVSRWLVSARSIRAGRTWRVVASNSQPRRTTVSTRQRRETPSQAAPRLGTTSLTYRSCSQIVLGGVLRSRLLSWLVVGTQ